MRSKDETPEGAALPILNALYSTIQCSMVLAKIRPLGKFWGLSPKFKILGSVPNGANLSPISRISALFIAPCV